MRSETSSSIQEIQSRKYEDDTHESQPQILYWGAGHAIGLVLLAGCGKKDDPTTQAEKKDADKPGAMAIKDTVKEAYIYGFPMLMNYGVMHAYFIDRNSGQFKAPFNTIYNEARVFTYKDTTIVTPNSDTPLHSSGWTCGRSPSC